MASTEAEQVMLVALGEVPASILEELAAGIEEVLGLRVRVSGALPLPRRAWRPERSQYVSSHLLSLLRRAVPGARLLAVTEADLFAPGLNFVFGEAEMPGRVAVISTCRLHEEFWGRAADALLLRRRSLTEAVHELGHTLGLGHCPDTTCVMHFSNTLADTDRKGPLPCPRCRSLLA